MRWCHGSSSAFGLFPFFLSPESGEIEKIISSTDRFAAAPIGRVGVEDIVTDAEKAAQAGLFGRFFLPDCFFASDDSSAPS